MAILSELPDSSVIRILIRLPVKSLSQCRFVSKSWYNLVKDPYFIRSHLSEQLADEKGYLVTAHQFAKMEEYYSFRCDETFRAKLKVERPIYDSTRALSLVGCAKGLLLILGLQISDYDLDLWNPSLGKSLQISDNDLYLWNPSLGKIKCLPIARARCLPIDRARCKIKVHEVAFGVAFLSEICDYKVIRIVNFFSNVSGVAEFYSLRTDSWKIIETPVMQLMPLYNYPCVAAFVKPFFYWVVRMYENGHWTACIVSFNIKCETFKTIGLPVASLEFGGKEGLKGSLAVFQESLYFFTFRTGEGWSLWMMKEDSSSEMCWLKMCTFEYQDRQPVGFMQNGDVIMEDEKRKVSLHDPKNVSSPRKSEYEMGWELKYSKVYNYSPSLALLDQ